MITASFSDSSGSNFERGIFGLSKMGDRSWVSQKFASSSRFLNDLLVFMLAFFIYFPFFFTHVSGRDNVWFIV